MTTPKKRGGGRPTLLTPETSKRICDLVRKGNYPETAAAAAGVNRQTLHGWMKEGATIRARLADGDTGHLSGHRKALVEFSAELERAFAEAEARDVMLIGRSAQGTDKRPGDWRAAAFLLERRNKQRWSERVENNVVSTSAVTTTVKGETPGEWMRRKINQLRDAQEKLEAAKKGKPDAG